MCFEWSIASNPKNIYIVAIYGGVHAPGVICVLRVLARGLTDLVVLCWILRRVCGGAAATVAYILCVCVRAMILSVDFVGGCVWCGAVVLCA